MLKKIILVAVAAACVAGLAACSFMEKSSQEEEPKDDPFTLSKPEHPIRLMFDGIKSAELETVKKASPIPEEYLSDDIMDSISENLKNPIVSGAITLVYSSLSYEITEVKMENDDRATVTISVSYPDLSPIIKSAFVANAPTIVKEALAGTLDKEKTMQNVFMSVVQDVAKKPKIETIKENIAVTSIKTDGKWQLEYNEALVNACTGNAINTAKGLDYSILMK